MSEEVNKNTEEEIDSVKIRNDKTEKADWLLQAIIDRINGSDNELGITLNVAGFLVSGKIISGHKYFEHFAEEYVTGWEEGEIKEKTMKTFLSMRDLYPKEKKKRDNTFSNYLHLKDAKFYYSSGNPIPGNRGVLWRSRVSEVSGFFLGTLSAEMS